MWALEGENGADGAIGKLRILGYPVAGSCRGPNRYRHMVPGQQIQNLAMIGAGYKMCHLKEVLRPVSNVNCNAGLAFARVVNA
jgi:hypothetical protein